ncbi:MAG TPA: PIN domain-containing protein [Terriglobales bacterium]
MIAADTSTWIAFLGGNDGTDVQLLASALSDHSVAMTPAVLAELLSDPVLPASTVSMLCDLPLMSPAAGYWERAGRLRAKVRARKRKARLADALIAQSCIDSETSLITRDRDFRAFAEAAGLNIAAG